MVLIIAHFILSIGCSYLNGAMIIQLLGSERYCVRRNANTEFYLENARQGFSGVLQRNLANSLQMSRKVLFDEMDFVLNSS